MPIYLEHLTPRQIAQNVVVAVMDAAMLSRRMDPREQQLKLEDAVIDALKEVGIELVMVAHDGVNDGA